MSLQPAETKNRGNAPDPKQLPPIFTHHHLRLMAYASLMIAFSVFIFVLAKPLYLEIPTVRTIVCMMISLPVSVFFFVFWPQQLEVTVIPLIYLPIRVAGPVVLWLVVLALFLFVMPHEDRLGKLFEVRPTDPQQKVTYIQATEFRRKATGELLPTFRVIEHKDKNTHLESIYGEFERGEEEIAAVMKMPGYQAVDVVFSRTSPVVTIPIVRLEGE